MRDFGYDVSDYNSITRSSGRWRTSTQLLAACHARGLRLMTDLVLNHTSDEHPWFQESRTSRDNPKRDWYIWRDGRAPGKPPNRWVSVAEGSPWQYDETTGQYYYHAFLDFQPDLNWRNPEVRQEMLDVLRFWLDKGVDGFRLDLINFLYEDELLRENPRKLGWRPYFWQHHIYDRSRPESLEAARDLRRLTDSYPDRALMGEVCSEDRDDTVAYLGDGSDATAPLLLPRLRPGQVERGALPRVGGLAGGATSPPTAGPATTSTTTTCPAPSRALEAGGTPRPEREWPPRCFSRCRGTPIIYAGEEIGMPMSKVPRGVMKDPLGTKYWPLSQGRDGARTPMQWSTEKNAGFTSGRAVAPRGPVARREERGVPGRRPGLAAQLVPAPHPTAREQPGAAASGATAPSRTPRRASTRTCGSREDEKVAVFLNFTARSLTVQSGLLTNWLVRRADDASLDPCGDATESALCRVSSSCGPTRS